MKKKVAIVCTVILVFLVAVFFLKWDAIFQRGNPIPYLTAAFKLSETNPYVAVDELKGIYISKRGDKDALFQMIQDTYGVELKDQLGSSYIFSDGENNYTISSEIYGVDLQSGRCLRNNHTKNSGVTQSRATPPFFIAMLLVMR